MKITNATIENYRSIETLDVDLSSVGDSNCRILAGINESGKSNILRALALLSQDSKLSYAKDANKKARSKKEEVRVRYRLEDSATQTLRDHLITKGVPEEVAQQLDIEKIERVVAFDASSARSDYFFVYLKEAPKLSETYQYSSSQEAIVKIEQEEAAEATADPPSAPSTPAAPPTPVATVTTPAATPATAAPTADKPILLNDKDSWESALEDYASEALENQIPKVIFWTYKDEYLINQAIDLKEFADKPATISKPLHNVFNLAKYTDAQIPVIIADALADESQMGELADKLAKAITDYLEEVWPEHRVSIKVHTANPTISFHVVEKDATVGGRYEVAERSDGFKHFFAILLNLAAENSTSQLNDCLILLDEPEVHLHPSGAKFLRDELLKIAKNNVVVYSTHSIFMIDRSCLDRHYKVSKDNETTQLLKIDSSNPFKEELIYESLGTSILDLISEHNVLFEGLTDKKLFEAFTHKFRTDIQPLDVMAMNVDGEQHFDKYCKFFNKKNIKGYIITDSDTDGMNAKTRILRDNAPEYNVKNTFEINDIVATGKKSSLEDLLPAEVLQKCVQDYCGVTLVLDSSKTFREQLDNYNRSASTKIDLSKLKEFICDFVCNDITKRSMTKEATKQKYPLYHQFVTNLHSKLKDANAN